MKSIVHQARVSTSHGQIAVETAGGDGPAVLLIHGNSSCRGVFRKQMQSAIAGRARLIALDLPATANRVMRLIPSEPIRARAWPPPLSKCSARSPLTKRSYSVGRWVGT